jgi:hypothetical protein
MPAPPLSLRQLNRATLARQGLVERHALALSDATKRVIIGR